MDLSISQFQLFFLVFIRIATMVVLMPVFGYRGIPNQAKIGLALFLTMLIFPIIQDSKAAMLPFGFAQGRPGVISFALLVGKEVLAGAVIGFATVLLFIGVQMSGRIVDIQMGFGIANVIDPQSQARISLIGQFEYLLAILIFLSIDGHHFLLRALEKSFELIPPGGAQFPSMLTEKMVTLTGGLFEIAVQIGAPVIAALFMASVVLGLIARAMPQMNVFIVGLPLKIGVGLLAIALSLPLFLYLFKALFAQFQRDILTLVRLL